jgi:hypothetical protein
MLLIPNGKIQNFPTVVELGGFSNFIDQPFTFPSIGNLATMEKITETIVEKHVQAFMLSFWGDSADRMCTYFSLNSGKALKHSISSATVATTLIYNLKNRFASKSLITPRSLTGSPEVELLAATLHGQSGFYLYDGEKLINAYEEIKRQLCTE